jgi:hypothetical protein
LRANLKEADLFEANLQGAAVLSVDMLCEARTLYKAELDPEPEKQVKERCPDLLKPSE